MPACVYLKVADQGRDRKEAGAHARHRAQPCMGGNADRDIARGGGGAAGEGACSSSSGGNVPNKGLPVQRKKRTKH